VSEALRDRLILFVPYITKGLIGFAIITFIRTRSNTWPVWLCGGGLPALIGSTVTWLTPLRAVQIRH